jgi:hypothetical protein
MKTEYPSIAGPAARYLGAPCVAFHKYDGSNLRFLWQGAQGWFRFGTRSQWLKKKTPIFGGALDLFQAAIAPGLLAVVREHYPGVRNLAAFCEFFGPSSFAGMHDASEPKDLRLFDVWMPNSGFVPPKEFVERFGRLPIAEAVYEGPFDREFVESVKAGKYPVREGVVAKGTVRRGEREEVWSAKVKTRAWLDELARRAGESDGLRQQLADNLSEQIISLSSEDE